MNPGPLPHLDWLADAIEAAVGKRRFTLALVRLAVVGNLRQQASELSDGVVPRDLGLLTDLVHDPSIPLEVRGKVLEVMLCRGALNEYSYDQMSEDTDQVGAVGWMLADKEFGFAERRAYQEAVRDAVSADRALFDQLSQSKDQMAQGRSPATEFMNTMLRNGGLYGNDGARQEFERKLEDFPAETRGRAMYHLLDAGRTAEIHLKGESRKTGYSIEVSVGTQAFSFGVGYGEQWEYVDNHHWQEVGRDIRREMNADLDSRTDEYKDDHEAGFREAARRDGALPGE